MIQWTLLAPLASVPAFCIKHSPVRRVYYQGILRRLTKSNSEFSDKYRHAKRWSFSNLICSVVEVRNIQRWTLDIYELRKSKTIQRFIIVFVCNDSLSAHKWKNVQFISVRVCPPMFSPNFVTTFSSWAPNVAWHWIKTPNTHFVVLPSHFG